MLGLRACWSGGEREGRHLSKNSPQNLPVQAGKRMTFRWYSTAIVLILAFSVLKCDIVF